MSQFRSSLRRLLSRLDAIFIATVALPTLLALLYFGLIASDVYVSESHFVVRNQQRNTQVGLGALLQGTGLSPSQDDSYLVRDYILSRDALHELDDKLKIRRLFSDPSIDLINRFPGLGWDSSFEAFHRHYLNQITVDYDTSSSISTLTVRAFSAADAKSINDALLQMSERLVNELNDRSREDLVAIARREVQTAETRAKAAALAVSEFRTNRTVFDPSTQSALQLQGVARIQEQLIAAEAQLAEVRRVAPNNPQVATLQARVEQLRSAIDSETGKVTGVGKGTLASKAPEYERLALEQTFADKQLASAMASLEQARYDAALKQLYLERIASPSLPDYATEPRRVRSILMVFVLGMILWGVLSLVVASVREHAD
jgi:capsular polysaccharide transport system permease protein